MRRRASAVLILWLAVAGVRADSGVPVTNTFRVATYNVENWLLMERAGLPDQPKPKAAREAVLTVLAELRPDVLALQELGGATALAEIADGLAARGLEYPHRETFLGADPHRRVGLLSRFPVTDRFSRGDYTYTIGTNILPIQRGILDVNLRVNDRYSFRALVVHFKSRRNIEEFDQGEMRLNEARRFRAHIGKALKDQPDLNLLALGDFNDVPDSAPLRVVVGDEPFRLFVLPARTPRGYTGTHYWRGRREWSRIDYLIASPGMAREYVAGSARVVEHPAAGEASDHRPVAADFLAADLPAPPAPAIP